ncbi:DUF3793 family protein [Geobacter sp. SVR]|uniref:DUF3793 family protein n=1 Tax=Geobacter sp. SVR TaxID=2495594 RepID=UPI00143EFE3B|nr:DUF3793 family protein [Geobacter sp. SVR]BCS55342.1 hypothetical protein GSVR_36500 [Geobacter sp. SVR]GCF87267.1 hypothetical protein GSbR_38670 [Geobacter sp. SVR]
MAQVQRTTGLNGRAVTAYPLWNDLAPRFSGTRDCFAAYLALEAAEVVEGEKPGNLVNLVNRTRRCGLNPYRIWKTHGAALLSGSGLKVRELKDSGEALLVYLYREDLLQELLQMKAVTVILGKLGYKRPADPEQTLCQLGARTRADAFPHEIGIFLGYPLKDVLAFMGRIPLAYACQGPWKIFGDPRRSLELADRFRECRSRMAERLYSCHDPAQCLMARAVCRPMAAQGTGGNC